MLATKYVKNIFGIKKLGLRERVIRLNNKSVEKNGDAIAVYDDLALDLLKLMSLTGRDLSEWGE